MVESEINAVELPGFVVSALYKDNLVAGESPGKPIQAMVSAYPTLGRNRKNITIIGDAPGADTLPPSQLALIEKMLGACKISLDDVAIINHAAGAVDIARLKTQTAPAILLLFGVLPTSIQLPVSFPPFKTQEYDGCTFLHVPALDAFNEPTEEAKMLKSKLWVCLRTLFEL